MSFTETTEGRTEEIQTTSAISTVATSGGKCTKFLSKTILHNVSTQGITVNKQEFKF
jgi:hypothetical protein